VQRLGEAGLPAAGVQLGDEQAGGGVPELHRPGETQQVVPVIGDQLGLDRPAEQWPGVRIGGPPARMRRRAGRAGGGRCGLNDTVSRISITDRAMRARRPAADASKPLRPIRIGTCDEARGTVQYVCDPDIRFAICKCVHRKA
jgi:hypothetical protein